MPYDETSVAVLFEQITRDFKSRPFVPHRIIKQGDAQTLGSYLWPGRIRPRENTGDEERLFQVEPGSQVLARCRWQANRAEHSTIVIWHGMEGSTASAYMLTTADKAFRVGFNVVRVNFRNCGGTEHLSPTLYHAGLTGDLRAVLDELIARDGLSRIFIAGFSLGGNMVLKLAGEYGDNPPTELRAVCTVSPSIKMRASCDLMMQRRNWIYQRHFLRSLKQRIRVKEKLFPDLYDSTGLRRIRSIEQFDDRYIAPMFGFENADDYYAKASSLPVISRIRIPTLMIHAVDDPFIPFAPLRDPSIAANPYVLLIAPAHGGHVAFMSANSRDEDRFWAENRVVEFCEAIRSAD
ncbi:MAG TPA: alpha/beta fold hydrolase [Pyrinomonadaceae bacterium]|nr:alpha/beta fold hydrolase [Pyrinomonadaceae bacterium]